MGTFFETATFEADALLHGLIYIADTLQILFMHRTFIDIFLMATQNSTRDFFALDFSSCLFKKPKFYRYRLILTCYNFSELLGFLKQKQRKSPKSI
jgi:hypothetical protein